VQHRDASEQREDHEATSRKRHHGPVDDDMGAGQLSRNVLYGPDSADDDGDKADAADRAILLQQVLG